MKVALYWLGILASGLLGAGFIATFLFLILTMAP